MGKLANRKKHFLLIRQFSMNCSYKCNLNKKQKNNFQYNCFLKVQLIDSITVLSICAFHKKHVGIIVFENLKVHYYLFNKTRNFLVFLEFGS